MIESIENCYMCNRCLGWEKMTVHPVANEWLCEECYNLFDYKLNELIKSCEKLGL